MIPLLALGVPGDVITGVMLGAFMIQGLTPGPLLFQTNIHEVYMLFIGMLFSSVLLFFAGKVIMRGFSHVARIPQSLLAPVVLLLCLFGIYSIASSMFDVAILPDHGCDRLHHVPAQHSGSSPSSSPSLSDR